MATKTISVDLEAYERLVQARRTPGESFSKVIKRAQWGSPQRRCRDLLDRLRAVDPMDADEIEALEAAQESDAPPEARWTD